MQTKSRPIFSIDGWTRVFFVYMSVYLERNPNRAIELIKYDDLIRKLFFILYSISMIFSVFSVSRKTCQVKKIFLYVSSNTRLT